MGRLSRVWLVLPIATVWLLVPGPSDGLRTFGINLVLIAVPAAAGFACVSTALRRRRSGGSQLSFWLLGAGCLSWSLGNAVWTVLVALGATTAYVPSPADPFYYALIPCTAAALIALPHRARSMSARLRRLCDSLIVATSLLAVGYPLFVLPIFDGLTDPLGIAVAIAYPTGDFVLLTLAIPLALGAAPRWRGVMLRLCAALLPLTAADVAYCITSSMGTYSTASPICLGWIAAFCAVLVFALGSPSGRRAGSSAPVVLRARTRTALTLLRHVPILAAAGTALVLLLDDRLNRITGVAVLLVLVLSALRQQLALWENTTLTLELESRVEQRTEQLAVLAYTDPLTRLANRARFALRLAETTADEPVLLLIDLDGFKVVNDTLGHAEGDELLAQVANRLRRSCAGADVLARLGGDEFAVLLGRCTLQSAAGFAERVLDGLTAPFMLGRAEVRLGASIGIAGVVSGDGDSENDGDTGDGDRDLLRHADLAMYAAKAAGRNCWRAFDPAMGRAAEGRRALVEDLRTAVAAGELSLAYQPIVELGTGRLLGAEALLRWQHPEHGMVPPDVFVPLAEETGLIVPLGAWVLSEACAQAARWREGLADGTFAISVNLSVHQLQPSFVAHVAAVLAETGLPAQDLLLEVTESVFMDDDRTDPELLQEIRRLGPRILLDDFGTGYSSLSYLQRFPVDGLKIDRSFVAPLADGDGGVIAEAVLRIADSLDLAVIAEGVEEPAQREALIGLGCRVGQGFGLLPPMPASSLDGLLSGATTVPLPRTVGAAPSWHLVR